MSSTGEEANSNSDSYYTAVSANGRYVAFASSAPNLVPGDTNHESDVFVRDLSTGVTTLVSVSSTGAQANRDSRDPAISANGRYVAFGSDATNLVPGDTNHESDVFVRDLSAHVTRRVSVGAAGAEPNSVSDSAAISANGRYVAFASYASNLVAGDTNNHEVDVFVRDLSAHVTRRVSVGAAGGGANGDSVLPAISADGRYVAFESDASNLVANDTNRAGDVFVRDRSAHVTRRVSVGPGGRQANSSSGAPAISAHGRYVAFESHASNLVANDTSHRSDVFVRNLSAHVTRRVSVGRGGRQADNPSFEPAISAHGRYVAFSSRATNLVAGDTSHRSDVFVRNLSAHVTRRVSVGPGGRQANYPSFEPAISADGRYVAFSSLATNLVAGDTNESNDVFVRDRLG